MPVVSLGELMVPIRRRMPGLDEGLLDCMLRMCSGRAANLMLRSCWRSGRQVVNGKPRASCEAVSHAESRFLQATCSTATWCPRFPLT